MALVVVVVVVVTVVVAVIIPAEIQPCIFRSHRRRKISCHTKTKTLPPLRARVRKCDGEKIV